KRTVPFRLANSSPIQVVANDDTNTYNLLVLDRSNNVRMFTPGSFKFGSTDATLDYFTTANGTASFNGYVDLTQIAAPSNPAVGKFRLYADLGTGFLACINSSGASVLPSGGGGGSGTVTSVSVSTANGVSGSVVNPTTTPAITLTLGAITPTTVNGLTVTANGTNTLNIAAGKTVTHSATTTFAGTDSKTLTISNSGTL